MYILGITGKIHSGKDTVFAMMKELLSPWKVERVAFADSLKQEVAKAVNVSVEYIDEHKDNFRLILQGWGTDFRRKLYGEDYWTWIWCRRVNYIAENTHLIVATDVRFLNEAKVIHDIGGKIIRVTRDTIGHTDLHASETEQDAIKANFQILNNGTMVELQQSVTQCLVDIKQRYMNGYEYKNSADGTKSRVAK